MNDETPNNYPLGLSEGQRTWDTLYGQRGVVQAQPSPEVVWAIGEFKRVGVEKVLDLGCGTGRHTQLLAEAGFDVYACDYSREALQIALSVVPEAELQQAQMVALPYGDESFDGILCYQVIQHALLCDVHRAVREIARVARSRSTLFLRVPSTAHPEAATGTEIEPGTRMGIDAIDGDMPHHYFTRGELEQYFEDFEILSLIHKHHRSGKDPTRPAASWSVLARCRPGLSIDGKEGGLRVRETT